MDPKQTTLTTDVPKPSFNTLKKTSSHGSIDMS